jgi:CHAT domain-containing protein
MNNLGTVYASRSASRRDTNYRKAIGCYRQALELRTPETMPDRALQTARNLGALHFEHGAWPEAIKAYRIAQAASDTLYLQAITEAGKRAEIGRGQGVAHQMAYALAQECDLDEAVLELERGRARLLAEALARDRAVLDQADDRDRNKYEEVVAEIRALENELRAAELHAQRATSAPTTARPFVEIADDLSSVRETLSQVVEAIRQRPGYEDFLTEPDFDDVFTAVQSNMPLVYLVATPAGGLALVVHHERLEQVPLYRLTDKILLARVRRWDEVYFTYLEARRTLAKAEKERTADLERMRSAEESARRDWNAILVDTTRWLWNAVMEPIVTTLSGLGYRQATLIPTGFLAFLPLHAAWRPGEKGAPPRYALDDVAFAYAPSALALTYARQVADDVSGDKLFAVNNPDGSLCYASQEVNAVVGHFEKPRQVTGYKATRNTVLRALSNYDVYHFACHGSNDWQSPQESALWMYGGVPLTVIDLLDSKEGAQVRLAFLSACETGLIGTELPDEVVGLATGFMQAGAAGVVSTLWSVDDESTASLAGRFYENWKVGNMSPLEALVDAQQWLRDHSGRDQWKHLHHWAAFTMTGV